MGNIDHLLIQLKDPDSTVRLDACRQLELEPELPADAIVTLRQLLNDVDSHVAQAANRALSTHSKTSIHSKSSGRHLPSSSTSAEKPSIIGNLAWHQWGFMLVGTAMIIMTIHDAGLQWGTLIVFLFFVGCITIMGAFSLHQHKRLVEIWSELANQTGLELDQGRSVFFGNSIPPSVHGSYRGRCVSISKSVQHEAAYEGSIPVVFTCISLEVKNLMGAYLTVGTKSLVRRIFKSVGGSSGDQQLDKSYQFDGYPPDFLRYALLMMVRYRWLFDRPKENFSSTDSPLSATSWRRPSIELIGSQLICMQSGVPTYILDQVQMLNLLCNLAELAEALASDQAAHGAG